MERRFSGSTWEGGASSFTVGTSTNAPNAIAVDEQYVYWNDVFERTAKRMPLGGGIITVLASDQGYLAGIATDGVNVYWAKRLGSAPTETGYIMKVARDGGTPAALVSQPTATNFVAVDPPYVYWTSAASGEPGKGAVSRVRTDGSQPAEVLVSGLAARPFGITTDASYVYWVEDTDPGGAAGRVMKLKK